MLLTKKFGSLDELIDFMQDYVITRELKISNPQFTGLTVIINPAGAGNQTITFGTATSPVDMVAAINAIVPGAAELRAYGHAAYGGVTHAIAFVNPNHVIQISGTANALLGLSTAVTSTPMTSVVTPGQVVEIIIDNPIVLIYDDWVTEDALASSAALTGGFVASSEVRVDQLRNISVLLSFTTGATGGTDEWLPQVQIEVSSEEAPAAPDWHYINTQAVSSGVVTNTRATYLANAGAMYTVHSTDYRDVIAAFENNPGWKWMRISIQESKTPTNHGTATLVIAGSKR